MSAPSALRSSAASLVAVDDVGDLDVRDAGRRDQLGQVLGHRADEADLDAAEVLDPGRRRAPGCRSALNFTLAPRYSHSAPPWGCRRVVRRHHPVDQVVVALVELVVADRGDLEAGLVERVDRRLVVLDERLERRGTDQVTGGGEHRVRVLAAQLLDRTGQHRGTRLGAVGVVGDPAVEVVGAEDLDRPSSVGVAGVDADDLRVVVRGARTGVAA